MNLYRYNLLFSHVKLDWQPPACLLNDDIAGIIFHEYADSAFRDRYMRRLPCVALQSADPDFGCSCVKLDNFSWFHQAVGHLARLGHKRIGRFAINNRTVNSGDDAFRIERDYAFRRALEYHGLEYRPDWSVAIERGGLEKTLDYTLPDYSDNIAPVMMRQDAPTAVIGESHAYAFGEALKKLGKRVPTDVSLVTQHNMKMWDDGPLRFTYLCDRLEDICIKAAQLMVDTLDSAVPVDNITVLVRPELITGNTTRKI